MEHVNAATSLRQQLQQPQYQQQQQQHHQLQQQTQLQQHQNDNQQQFCLRWHNHQTSLLSTLPILLDQSHLTDVTLSAEGRTLRAHRVVLSACSTFFLELFRALDTTNHPVIIIPGASFAAIMALLTFMYSGEVNVYEEQIPTLLSLAETLGIKGLADVQNNLQKNTRRQPDITDPQQVKQQQKLEVETPPTPLSPPDFNPQHGSALLPSTAPLGALQPPSAAGVPKVPTPLENLFLKSLQFYPNLLPQPLNFSQSALNKTSELLAKYQQHCSLYQSAFSGCISPLQQQLEEAPAIGNEASSNKRLCTSERRQHQHQQQKDIKRIDKIVESLRCSNKAPPSDSYMAAVQHPQLQPQQHQQQHFAPLSVKTSIASFGQNLSPHLSSKPGMFTAATSQQQQKQQQQQATQPSMHRGYGSLEEPTKLQQTLEHFAASADVSSHKLHESSSLLCMPELPTPTPASPQPKAPANSKLYATCFICHKQLSNQYNLRVHLETHQNVRYACSVCSHVSRSKDALRKHVSYRHPGAPSPCDSEARRKRSKTLNIATPSTSSTVICSTPSPSSAPTTPISMVGCTGEMPAETTMPSTPSTTPTSTSLSSAFMFLPNQFHLAAAAAAAANGQQQISNTNNNSCTNAANTTITSSILNTTIATSTANCNLMSTATNLSTPPAAAASTPTQSAETNTPNSMQQFIKSNVISKSERNSAESHSSSSSSSTHATAGAAVGRLPSP